MALLPQGSHEAVSGRPGSDSPISAVGAGQLNSARAESANDQDEILALSAEADKDPVSEPAALVLGWLGVMVPVTVGVVAVEGLTSRRRGRHRSDG